MFADHLSVFATLSLFSLSSACSNTSEIRFLDRHCFGFKPKLSVWMRAIVSFSSFQENSHQSWLILWTDFANYTLCLILLFFAAFFFLFRSIFSLFVCFSVALFSRSLLFLIRLIRMRPFASLKFSFGQVKITGPKDMINATTSPNNNSFSSWACCCRRYVFHTNGMRGNFSGRQKASTWTIDEATSSRHSTNSKIDCRRANLFCDFCHIFSWLDRFRSCFFPSCT